MQSTKYSITDTRVDWIGPFGKKDHHFRLELELYKERDSSCQGFLAIIHGVYKETGWLISLRLKYIGSNLQLGADERDITIGQAISWIRQYVGMPLVSSGFYCAVNCEGPVVDNLQQLHSFPHGIMVPHEESAKQDQVSRGPDISLSVLCEQTESSAWF